MDAQDWRATLGNDQWLQGQGVDVMMSLRSAVERTLREAGVSEDIADSLAWYGHAPELWERKFLSRQSDHYWRQKGHSLVFDDLARIFKTAEISKVLLLVDEVEKIVNPQNSLERRAFVDDLRRFFIDGPYQSVYSRLYNVLWTIYPYIQELWQPRWQGAGLDRICPIAGGTSREYAVYFYPLDAEETAVPLAQTYLDYFRVPPEQKGALKPFDEQAVVEALRLAGGLPGKMLEVLRLALERAVREGWDTIRTEQIRAIYESGTPAEPVDEDDVGSMAPPRVDLRGDNQE